MSSIILREKNGIGDISKIPPPLIFKQLKQKKIQEFNMDLIFIRYIDRIVYIFTHMTIITQTIRI